MRKLLKIFKHTANVFDKYEFPPTLTLETKEVVTSHHRITSFSVLARFDDEDDETQEVDVSTTQFTNVAELEQSMENTQQVEVHRK